MNESEEKVKKFEESKKNLKNQVEEIQKEKIALENSAVENKLLTEGLETELSDTKLKLKESLIQQLQILRLAIGKEELDNEKISAREESSIRDSIMDIQEDFQSLVSRNKKDIKEKQELPKPNSVTDPSIHDDNDKKSGKLNLKESEDGNIDLKAGLENIFSSMMRLRV